MITNTRFRQIVAQQIVEEYGSTSANIYVYSGAIPSTQTEVDSWTAGGYAGQLICTFTGFTLIQETTALDNIIFGTFPFPATVTAANAGDATWYVLHSTQTAPPDVVTGTGYSYYIMGTVSTPGGNGSLQLDVTTGINVGDSITVIDFNVRVARG